MRGFASILFFLLGALLICTTGYRNFELISYTLPADQLFFAFVGLIATEGGLLIWTMLFIYHSRGGIQRGIALLMIIISIIGISAGTALDMFLQASRKGAVQTLDRNGFSFIIYILAALVVANVIAFVFYHIYNPTLERERKEREARDIIEEEALKQTIARAQTIAGNLADYQAAKWEADMRAQYTNGQTSEPPKLPQPKTLEYKPAQTFNHNSEVVTPPVSVEYRRPDKRLKPLGNVVKLDFFTRNGNGQNLNPNQQQKGE